MLPTRIRRLIAKIAVACVFFCGVKNFSCHHFGKSADLILAMFISLGAFSWVVERSFLARGVWFDFWVLFFKPDSPARPRCQLF